MELQFVELLYPEKPLADIMAIKCRAEQSLGSTIDVAETEPTGASWLFFHTDRVISYDEGDLPAQTVVFKTDKEFDLGDYAEDLQQSWSTPNAHELLSSVQHTLAVTEMMTRALDPAARLEIFHGVLQAMVEVTKPAALVFKHSQQVIDPAAYLESCDSPPLFRVGSLNVRFFNVDGAGKEFVMDTRGLHEIGIHDLQCHFRNLPPNEVAPVLLNTAAYIVEHGPVIESGNTIEGTSKGSKWTCRFENSLVPPDRELLDIDPGPPFGAGNRHY